MKRMQSLDESSHESNDEQTKDQEINKEEIKEDPFIFSEERWKLKP